MNFQQLEDYFKNIPEEIAQDAPDIIAETAVEYFQKTFATKAFDGNPWAPPKKPKKTGSLLVQSGALRNSITPSLISPDLVVISAGNKDVSYARVHNEGFTGTVPVPAHSRKTKTGKVEVAAHDRNINLPKRQFLGKADELADKIHDRLEGFLNSIL